MLCSMSDIPMPQMLLLIVMPDIVAYKKEKVSLVGITEGFNYAHFEYMYECKIPQKPMQKTTSQCTIPF